MGVHIMVGCPTPVWICMQCLDILNITINNVNISLLGYKVFAFFPLRSTSPKSKDLKIKRDVKKEEDEEDEKKKKKVPY